MNQRVPARLYYDEDCGFCIRTARVMKRLARGRLTIAPFTSPQADEELRGVDPDLRYNQAWVIDEGGTIHGGPAAMWECFFRMPGGWLLRPLRHLPGFWPVSTAVYRWIANRRSPQCRLRHPTV